MRHLGVVDPLHVSPAGLTWRVTTAIRTFTLALAAGILLSHSFDAGSTRLLALLVALAAVATALEWMVQSSAAPWLPMGEALTSAVALAASDSATGLFAYMAVPPVVAGVRYGLVTTINTAFISGLATTATLILLPGADVSERLTECLPWLLVGLGVGLLASWQSRSLRDLELRRAPYAAAHQLMARLHRLAQSGEVGLDSTLLATKLDVALRNATGAPRSGVFVADPSGQLRVIAEHKDGADLVEEISLPEPERRPGAAVIPLRGANQVLGYCVLAGVQKWNDELQAQAVHIADDFALRLDTAVLFDGVRELATAEERNRIAREMHDGVAQEIVALGYVVDEIEHLSSEPATRELAATLRTEISRVVTELRYSIFDLRQHVDHELAAALADYVREVSRDTDLRVHLVLDSTGPQLPARTQSELLRIAQEAIGNVRRHASATNLWVTFTSDGSEVRLEVADDGVGNATPKARHWGLQTMQERAHSLGAELTIVPKAGGGTVVRVTSLSHTIPSERGMLREHFRTSS